MCYFQILAFKRMVHSVMLSDDNSFTESDKRTPIHMVCDPKTVEMQ